MWGWDRKIRPEDHRLASIGLPLVMTIDDCEGRIFRSHPHTNNGLFFLLTTKYLIIYLKKKQQQGKDIHPENPEYAELRYGDVILTLQLHKKLSILKYAYMRNSHLCTKL